MEWRPIESAPKDGAVIDVWLGDANQSDVDFYCTPGTRRSAGWWWFRDKFRPKTGLHQLSVFVEPTHWMPLPNPPRRSYDQVSRSLEEFARSDAILLSADLMRQYSGRWVAAYQGKVVTVSEDLVALRGQLIADKIPLSTVAIRFIEKDGLIAAAPELVAALEAVVTAWDSTEMRSREFHDNEIATARALLVRIKGE